jgi:hypothetical protein
MNAHQSDLLFHEIKSKLQDIKGKTELGIPIRKFDDELKAIKKELLVKWILRQRKKKLSYKQIEDILNTEQVPTLSGNSRWNAQTISNISKGK